MNRFCQSCGMPLPDAETVVYCRYCTDEKGDLKSREEIRGGISAWLEQFSPGGGSVDFNKRADSYMKAMPTWAGK
jgi:hypothetical protein